MNTGVQDREKHKRTVRQSQWFIPWKKDLLLLQPPEIQSRSSFNSIKPNSWSVKHISIHRIQIIGSTFYSLRNEQKCLISPLKRYINIQRRRQHTALPPFLCLFTRHCCNNHSQALFSKTCKKLEISIHTHTRRQTYIHRISQSWTRSALISEAFNNFSTNPTCSSCPSRHQ